MNKLTRVALSLAAIGVASWIYAGEPTTKPAEKTMCESGLTIIHISSGAGGARNGDRVWVHYAGRLENGTEVDNSFKRGKPIDFNLGIDPIIQGWVEGLNGMKVGEKRQLIIPPKLAYGEAGKGEIPPNATLIFDVELMGILRK